MTRCFISRLNPVLILISMEFTGPAPLWPQSPTFEVASVKVHSNESTIRHPPKFRNGTFTADSVLLRTLLAIAFDIADDRINGPQWIDSDKYDIIAKTADGGRLEKDDIQPLLQNLLQERFHLVVHTEIREEAAYNLLIAKGGCKLAAFDPGRPFKPRVTAQAAGAAVLSGSNITISRIAKQLELVVGRPVVDRTGIEGRFDYALTYTPLGTQRNDIVSDSSSDDLLTALQRQLGLQLASQKQPIKILMIDEAMRVPTQN